MGAGAIVDVDTGILRPGRLLLLSGTSGGYVALALGAGRLFRFAFLDNAEPHPFFDACRRIEAALDDNDLAKARRLGLPSALPPMDDRDLRRLAIAELLIKAGFNPDEPRDERGRWTTGGATEGDLSGQLSALTGRRRIRALLATALRAGRDSLAALVPGIGEIMGVLTVGDLVAGAAEVIQLGKDADIAAAFAKEAPFALDDLRVSTDDESFSSFASFRKMDEVTEKRFGSAGSGYQYHHIVEQGGANADNIPADLLNSTENIIRLPTLVHELINTMYSREATQEPGSTLRQWVQKKPYDEQLAFGVQILRDLGIAN
jgi:hypothetical protein